MYTIYFVLQTLTPAKVYTETTQGDVALFRKIVFMTCKEIAKNLFFAYKVSYFLHNGQTPKY